MVTSRENRETDAQYNAKPPLPELAQAVSVLIIPAELAGMRLDLALARLLPEWSRTRLQTWILENQISVDGKKALVKQKVWGGEQIEVNPFGNPAQAAHAPEALPLDIVHEDNAILVISKPAGMVVHPGSGNWQGTMLNALLHHAPGLNTVPRAGIVHRLDKDTSGLLVVAKTLQAQTSLVRQLQERSVKREYLALVLGQVSAGGWVDAPVGRHPVQRTRMAVTASGKQARTAYHPEEMLDGCTLLRCRLETGRTHQIRVHMQSIGHPLLGDRTYGGRQKNISPHLAQCLSGFSRQALHAQKLELTHPQHGERIAWETALPGDMHSLLSALRQRGTAPRTPCHA
jgi:23S rRNA pseudouridine1911/1915/1917 synthase